jgi:hypothetical protein
MSQLEQLFTQYLAKKPEIAKCYQTGLINRRALARHLIKANIAKKNQMDALVAMLRRYKFPTNKETIATMKDVRTNIKDKILILDFDKNKQLIKKLQTIITHAEYNKGDTLKIVVGTSRVKVFVDEKNSKLLKDIINYFGCKQKRKNISEISLLFPDKPEKIKGTLSFVTTELTLNDVIFEELLTASPELLLYIQEEYVVKAYEVLKRLQSEK